jgi:hypothetical protein
MLRTVFKNVMDYNLGNLQTRHGSEKWMSKSRVQVDVTSPGNFRRLLLPGRQSPIAN